MTVKPLDAEALLKGRLFLSVPEMSAIFGLDAEGRTVRQAIKDGEIPATRVGLQWRIPVAWVREQARLGPALTDAIRQSTPAA